MKNNGYNPLRWDCNDPAKGCYNVKQRPKIEVFADCFGGRINFGDVDAGIVEVNSRALLLEWKGAPLDVPVGQDIMFRNLSRTGLMVVITVAGDAETMDVSHLGHYVAGKFSGWKQANLERVKQLCRAWYQRARGLGAVQLHEALPTEKMTKQELVEWVADYEAHEHDFHNFDKSAEHS